MKLELRPQYREERKVIQDQIREMEQKLKDFDVHEAESNPVNELKGKKVTIKSGEWRKDEPIVFDHIELTGMASIMVYGYPTKKNGEGFKTLRAWIAKEGDLIEEVVESETSVEREEE